MAIYKLRDFCEYSYGSWDKKIKNLKEKKYPIISAGVDIKGFYSKYNRDGKYVCISGVGASAGHVTYYDGKFWASECMTLKLMPKKLIKNEYFKNIFFRKQRHFKSLIIGSAQPYLPWKIIKNLKVKIPSINEQQKIIDIIEPVERQINFVDKIKNNILFLVKNLNFKNTILMNDHVYFEKGKSLNSKNFIELDKNKKCIPFLDVKSLSGSITKFVDKNKFPENTKIGDVLLSLDGTPGRVSVENYGFNGYVYKIKSDKIPNSILWGSLLNKENQNIIKSFSFGTNILHATKAKYHIKSLNFENHNLVENLYKVYVLNHKIQSLLVKIKSLLIKLLITN